MRNNILEHEKLVIERINKSFGVESNGINKAIDSSLEESNDNSLEELQKAHNIGEEKVYQGVTYYVAGFNSKHIPLWRKKKGQTSSSSNSNTRDKKKEVKEENKKFQKEEVKPKEQKDDVKDNFKENNEEKKEFSVGKNYKGNSYEYSGNPATEYEVKKAMKLLSKEEKKKEIKNIDDIDSNKTYDFNQIQGLIPEVDTDGMSEKALDRYYNRFKEKFPELKDFHNISYNSIIWLLRNKSKLTSIKVENLGKVKENVKSSNIYDKMEAERYNIKRVSFCLKLGRKNIKVKDTYRTDKTLSTQDVSNFLRF